MQAKPAHVLSIYLGGLIFQFLQGWKLFAEAHKIQAYDQVSFELVAAKRMVVQVIRAADSPVCKKTFSYPLKARAPKAQKIQCDSSTQGSQQYLCDSEEVYLSASKAQDPHFTL